MDEMSRSDTAAFVAYDLYTRFFQTSRNRPFGSASDGKGKAGEGSVGKEEEK